MVQDPITRVLTTLEILQARDFVTGAELAERLAVDLRTVQRYIARLRDLNIPIEASPGVGGSYRLRPGFRLPPLLLTNEEAFAFSLGLRALRQIGLEAFAPATQGALAKLSRILPVALREGLEALQDVVAFERNAWTVATPAEHLMTVAAAIRGSQQIGFIYSARDRQPKHRVAEPYAVLHTDDRWYLLGYCLERQAVRTFRLDRVSEPKLRAETFKKPEDFNPHLYLAEHLPFVQSDYTIDVWIDLPIQQARTSFALWRVLMQEESGGTRIQCSRDNLDFFAGMLLSTRRRIVVHEPAALRDTFLELGKEATVAAQKPPSLVL
jgi:predicted DNA-binding transcriptional regulator YafY